MKKKFTHMAIKVIAIEAFIFIVVLGTSQLPYYN